MPSKNSYDTEMDNRLPHERTPELGDMISSMRRDIENALIKGNVPHTLYITQSGRDKLRCHFNEIDMSGALNHITQLTLVPGVKMKVVMVKEIFTIRGQVIIDHSKDYSIYSK
jgi:hypothetical protein